MHPSDRTPDPNSSGHRQEHQLAGTLFWIGLGIGVAGLGAALAYAIVRTAVARRAEDPTSQRIQHLIDEANSLLKTLDETRHSA